jgi:aspartate/methionine/tyrosine aminotransferase
MRLARRAERIEPFYVMEVAKAAGDLARQRLADGAEPMIFLNIGEPDFTAPPAVQAAAAAAIAGGHSQYTQATGLSALRERISAWYGQRFGLNIEPGRIIVTAGASAALQLACLALVDDGDEILMPDPSYPCNRHFVSAAGGDARLLSTTAAQRFQLDAQQVAQAWGPRTRGVLLASPSNPTGTSIHPAELARIAHTVRQRGGVCMIDEIYLPLSYDEAYGRSALALPDGLGDEVISVNSFSKYFNMTGWRLGWLVVPPALVSVVEKLAQNLYICASTLAQHAALACFEPDTLALYEQRRAAFKARRDAFVPALHAAGLPVPVQPDGAFYAWADCSAACARLGLASSWEFAFAAMEHAGVALTPGRDFGHADTARFVRLSTASRMEDLHTAAQRLQRWLQSA